MATMIPAVPMPPAGATGEAKVYAALAELPDGYRVYHSLPYYLLPSGREPLREGEIDFLILHPERGLLVLEVKGGRIGYEGRERRWTSTAHDGAVHEIRDPFRQAQQNVKNLVREIEALGVDGEAPLAFVHGHAVAFPDCDWRVEADPVGAPRELVADAGDLARGVERRVEELFALWARGRSGSGAGAGLTKRWVKKLGQQLLAPRFSLGLTLGTELAWEERALARLHEEQELALEFLELNGRAVVIGGAGTGKSVVACERARRLAQAGKRVLLLCFNLPLAHHLRELAGSWEGLEGRVTARAYHELGRDLCREAGLAWEEPDPDDREASELFWNETSGYLLLEAAGKLGTTFDALVVDEAQDFRTEWWGVLRELLPGRDAAPVALFADREQDLWSRGSVFPEGLPIFPLRTNSRNTAAIARFLAGIAAAGPPPGPTRLAPGAVPGEEPRVIRWRNGADEREKAAEVAKRLLVDEGLSLSRVAVVGMRRLENSSLAEKPELAGFPVEAIGDDGRARGAGALRYATPHRFKGLEADVVLLLGVDGSRWSVAPRNLYVAASRARHRLFLFAKAGVEVPGVAGGG